MASSSGRRFDQVLGLRGVPTYLVKEAPFNMNRRISLSGQALMTESYNATLVIGYSELDQLQRINQLQRNRSGTASFISYSELDQLQRNTYASPRGHDTMMNTAMSTSGCWSHPVIDRLLIGSTWLPILCLSVDDSAA